LGLPLVALGLFGLTGYGATSQHPTPPASVQRAASVEDKAAAGQQGAGAPRAEAHYNLTPEQRAKAIAYSRQRDAGFRSQCGLRSYLKSLKNFLITRFV
jgi:hypothetical protein